MKVLFDHGWLTDLMEMVFLLLDRSSCKISQLTTNWLSLNGLCCLPFAWYVPIHAVHKYDKHDGVWSSAILPWGYCRFPKDERTLKLTVAILFVNDINNNLDIWGYFFLHVLIDRCIGSEDVRVNQQSWEFSGAHADGIIVAKRYHRISVNNIFEMCTRRRSDHAFPLQKGEEQRSATSFRWNLKEFE